MREYKRLTNQKWSKDIDLTQELGYSHIYKGDGIINEQLILPVRLAEDL